MMTFKKAKNISNLLYCISAAVLLFAIFTMEQGSTLRTICIIVGAALILAGASLRSVWCTCPSCGEHVTNDLRHTKKCPKCGASLYDAK